MSSILNNNDFIEITNHQLDFYDFKFFNLTKSLIQNKFQIKIKYYKMNIVYLYPTLASIIQNLVFKKVGIPNVS